MFSCFLVLLDLFNAFWMLSAVFCPFEAFSYVQLIFDVFDVF